MSTVPGRFLVNSSDNDDDDAKFTGFAVGQASFCTGTGVVLTEHALCGRPCARPYSLTAALGSGTGGEAAAQEVR